MRRLSGLGRNLNLGIAAGGLYRIDTFLVAFDPGPGWHYFPSIPEMLVTLGFIAIEMAAYAVLVKIFPILRPARRGAEHRRATT